MSHRDDDSDFTDFSTVEECHSDGGQTPSGTKCEFASSDDDELKVLHLLKAYKKFEAVAEGKESEAKLAPANIEVEGLSIHAKKSLNAKLGEALDTAVPATDEDVTSSSSESDVELLIVDGVTGTRTIVHNRKTLTPDDEVKNGGLVDATRAKANGDTQSTSSDSEVNIPTIEDDSDKQTAVEIAGSFNNSEESQECKQADAESMDVMGVVFQWASQESEDALEVIPQDHKGNMISVPHLFVASSIRTSEDNNLNISKATQQATLSYENKRITNSDPVPSKVLPKKESKDNNININAATQQATMSYDNNCITTSDLVPSKVLPKKDSEDKDLNNIRATQQAALSYDNKSFTTSDPVPSKVFPKKDSEDKVKSTTSDLDSFVRQSKESGEASRHRIRTKHQAILDSHMKTVNAINSKTTPQTINPRPDYPPNAEQQRYNDKLTIVTLQDHIRRQEAAFESAVQGAVAEYRQQARRRLRSRGIQCVRQPRKRDGAVQTSIHQGELMSKPWSDRMESAVLASSSYSESVATACTSDCSLAFVAGEGLEEDQIAARQFVRQIMATDVTVQALSVKKPTPLLEDRACQTTQALPKLIRDLQKTEEYKLARKEARFQTKLAQIDMKRQEREAAAARKAADRELKEQKRQERRSKKKAMKKEIRQKLLLKQIKQKEENERVAIMKNSTKEQLTLKNLAATFKSYKRPRSSLGNSGMSTKPSAIPMGLQQAAERLPMFINNYEAMKLDLTRMQNLLQAADVAHQSAVRDLQLEHEAAMQKIANLDSQLAAAKQQAHARETQDSEATTKLRQSEKRSKLQVRRLLEMRKLQAAHVADLEQHLHALQEEYDKTSAEKQTYEQQLGECDAQCAKLARQKVAMKERLQELVAMVSEAQTAKMEAEYENRNLLEEMHEMTLQIDSLKDKLAETETDLEESKYLEAQIKELKAQLEETLQEKIRYQNEASYTRGELHQMTSLRPAVDTSNYNDDRDMVELRLQESLKKIEYLERKLADALDNSSTASQDVGNKDMLGRRLEESLCQIDDLKQKLDFELTDSTNMRALFDIPSPPNDNRTVFAKSADSPSDQSVETTAAGVKFPWQDLARAQNKLLIMQKRCSDLEDALKKSEGVQQLKNSLKCMMGRERIAGCDVERADMIERLGLTDVLEQLDALCDYQLAVTKQVEATQKDMNKLIDYAQEVAQQVKSNQTRQLPSCEEMIASPSRESATWHTPKKGSEPRAKDPQKETKASTRQTGTRLKNHLGVQRFRLSPIKTDKSNGEITLRSQNLRREHRPVRGYSPVKMENTKKAVAKLTRRSERETQMPFVMEVLRKMQSNDRLQDGRLQDLETIILSLRRQVSGQPEEHQLSTISQQGILQKINQIQLGLEHIKDDKLKAAEEKANIEKAFVIRCKAKKSGKVESARIRSAQPPKETETDGTVNESDLKKIEPGGTPLAEEICQNLLRASSSHATSSEFKHTATQTLLNPLAGCPNCSHESNNQASHETKTSLATPNTDYKCIAALEEINKNLSNENRMLRDENGELKYQVGVLKEDVDYYSAQADLTEREARAEAIGSNNKTNGSRADLTESPTVDRVGVQLVLKEGANAEGGPERNMAVGGSNKKASEERDCVDAGKNRKPVSFDGTGGNHASRDNTQTETNKAVLQFDTDKLTHEAMTPSKVTNQTGTQQTAPSAEAAVLSKSSATTPSKPSATTLSKPSATTLSTPNATSVGIPSAHIEHSTSDGARASSGGVKSNVQHNFDPATHPPSLPIWMNRSTSQKGQDRTTMDEAASAALTNNRSATLSECNTTNRKASTLKNLEMTASTAREEVQCVHTGSEYHTSATGRSASKGPSIENNAHELQSSREGISPPKSTFASASLPGSRPKFNTGSNCNNGSPIEVDELDAEITSSIKGYQPSSGLDFSQERRDSTTRNSQGRCQASSGKPFAPVPSSTAITTQEHKNKHMLPIANRLSDEETKAKDRPNSAPSAMLQSASHSAAEKKTSTSNPKIYSKISESDLTITSESPTPTSTAITSTPCTPSFGRRSQTDSSGSKTSPLSDFGAWKQDAPAKRRVWDDRIEGFELQSQVDEELLKRAFADTAPDVFDKCMAETIYKNKPNSKR